METKDLSRPMDGLEVFHYIFEQDIFFELVSIALKNAAEKVSVNAPDIIITKGEDVIKEIVKNGYLIDFENRAFNFEELRHYFLSKLPIIKDLLHEHNEIDLSGHYALSFYLDVMNATIRLCSYFTGSSCEGIDLSCSRMDKIIYDVESSFNIVMNALEDTVPLATIPFFFSLFVETFQSEMGRLQQLQHTQEISNSDISPRLLARILQSPGAVKSSGNISRDEFTDYVVAMSMPNGLPREEDLPYETAFQASCVCEVNGEVVETLVESRELCGVTVTSFQMQNRSGEDALAVHEHRSLDPSLFEDAEVVYALQCSVRKTVQESLDLKRRLNMERQGRRKVVGGTTLLHFVLLSGGRLAVANVGDSMAYIAYELGGERQVEGLTAVADLQSYMMFQIVTDGKGGFLRKDSQGGIRYKQLDMNREIGHLEAEYSEPFFALRDMRDLLREGVTTVKVVLKSDCAHIFTDKGQVGTTASQIGRRIFYASKLCCDDHRGSVDDISVISFDLKLEEVCAANVPEAASLLICDGHGIGGDNAFSRGVAEIQIRSFEEKIAQMTLAKKQKLHASSK